MGATFTAPTPGQTYPELFGAQGDNSHDDTGAIQRAINTGKTVILQPGKTYQITAALNFPAVSGQRLLGMDSRTSVINQTTASEHAVNLVAVNDSVFGTGCYGIEISDIRFNGVGSATATGNGINGNTGAFLGDNNYFNNVTCGGFNIGVLYNGFGNTTWRNLNCSRNNYGFIGGDEPGSSSNATCNGITMIGVQCSYNNIYNLWVRYGSGWVITLADSHSGGANGATGIRCDSLVTMFGGNWETGIETGLRCIYVSSTGKLIHHNGIFKAGTNSKDVSPVYVEDLGSYQGQNVLAGGYNAGVTTVECALGANILGDGSFNCRMGGTNGTITGSTTTSATDGEVFVPNIGDPVRDDGIPTPTLANRGKLYYVATRASSGVTDRLLFIVRDAAGNPGISDALNQTLLETASVAVATWTFQGNSNQGGVKVISYLGGSLGDQRGALVISGDPSNSGDAYGKIIIKEQGVDYNLGTISFTAVDKTDSNAVCLLRLGYANGGQVIFPTLPTSASGLVSGQMWNNSGVLHIV